MVGVKFGSGDVTFPLRQVSPLNEMCIKLLDPRTIKIYQDIPNIQLVKIYLPILVAYLQ